MTNVFESQSYHDHPDRFDGVHQVLCRESVCGRCYWEIEWSGEYVYYQCHIRPSAERERVKSVCLEIMISPGVCTALLPVTPSITMADTHSDTIR